MSKYKIFLDKLLEMCYNYLISFEDELGGRKMPKKYEVIKLNDDKTLKFGNFEAIEKQKVADFTYNGDTLAVKTHKDITVLKKNDSLFIEVVPGAVLDKFEYTTEELKFNITGYKQSMVTVGVEPNKSYKVIIDGKEVETLDSKLSGKISVSLDIENAKREVVFCKA